LAGQVHIGFDVMVTSLPHVRTGALRALAVAGSRRFEALSEVPTVAETLPGYEARTWAGVGADCEQGLQFMLPREREALLDHEPLWIGGGHRRQNQAHEFRP